MKSNLSDLTDKEENKILRNLVLDLVSAIENGVEDQEIKYLEKELVETKAKLDFRRSGMIGYRQEALKLKKLILELVSAIENGVEDQEIKYAEKVVNDNEELIKEIRK